MTPLKQKLSPEQIEDIVNDFPQCLAATTKVAAKMREQIQNKLRLQLKDIEIVNTPKAIDRLKEMIRRQHYNSLVHPGEPVGIRAAESLSQPTTQMALNAFHSAGFSASTSSGIDAIQELYNVRKERKNENSYIHFCDKNYIFEDIIDLRRELKAVTIMDVLKSKPVVMKYRKETEPEWYNLYLDVTNRHNMMPIDRNEKVESDDYRHNFLRLYFDVNKLFSYNLTLINIANKINRECIFCIPSPTTEGIIDIFVENLPALTEVEKKNKNREHNFSLGVTNYNATILFIELILKPDLKEIIINDGIEKITDLYPIVTEVFALIKSSDYLGNGKWRSWLDDIQLTLKGIPLQKLLTLMNMCDMEVLEYNDKYVDTYGEINMTPEGSKEDRSPIKIMKDRVLKVKEAFDEQIEKQKQQGIYVRRQVPELLKASNYYYAISNGSNFMKLLGHPKVDSRVTTCSNPWEIWRALGIEAARNFLIQSYISIIKDNGHYSNPRHIMVTTDFQTRKGTLLSISSKSAARQNIGPLAQASFEQPMDAFIDAAAFGKSEEIKSTSTSIFVGKRMILGTGSFKARIDIEELDKAERKREEYRKLNPDKYEYANDSELSLLSSFGVDMELLVPTEDDEHHLNSYAGLVNASAISGFNDIPEFKIRNEVPKPLKAYTDLPQSILDIINPKSRLISGIKPLSLKLGVKPITSTDATLVPPGMPAIPKFNANQMVYNQAPAPGKVTLGDLDNFDF